MRRVVTMNRPEIIALVEEAAAGLTSCNETEAIGLAVRRVIERERGSASSFGVDPGSVPLAEDSDLPGRALDVEPDARRRSEIER